jgi:hypothetical protein
VTEGAAMSDDHWQCQSLLLRFVQSLDAGNADEAVTLLTPDVMWHRQGEVLVGRPAVREVINRRAPDRMIRHHLSNIVVTLRGPLNAASVAYYAVYLHEGRALPRVINGPAHVGDYHAEYIKADGNWGISSLRANRVFTSVSRAQGGQSMGDR